MPVNSKGNFIQADIKNLPLPSDYANLVTLRFVAEHFENINDYITELKRITKKEVKIIILTTNLLSSVIFLPRLLLPFSLKSKILSNLFKVKPDDVFPAYHKINTPAKFKILKNDFTVEKMIFISDLNYTRKWIFIVLLVWHIITAMPL